MDLRREPFRLLFPVGALLGLLGVAPWVLFGSGVTRVWPGTFHSTVMTQSFLVAIVIGFLATMIPRRTSSQPMSYVELGLASLGVVLIPVAALLDAQRHGHGLLPQGAFFATLVLLLRFLFVRMRPRKAAPGSLPQGRPPLPSFVFLPTGLLTAAAGAILLVTSDGNGQSAHFLVGRALVEEGLLFGLVLALAPMLGGIIQHGRGPTEGSRRELHLYAVAALLFLLSFGLQAWSMRAGLLLRGAVAAAVMLGGAKILESPSLPGVHRQLFRFALACVPFGLLAAGARPALRVPLLHFSFVGGLSLLVFAVSFHVAFHHTGRESLADRPPWAVGATGALTILATLARVTAERFSQHYVEMLTLAASLWLAAALVWGAALLVMVVRPAPTSSP